MFPRMRTGWFVVVVLLSATSLHAAVINIEGTVKSVDAEKRTITIDTGSESKTLDVSSKVKVSIEGKQSALDALTAGQQVKLSYHDDLEIVLSIEAVSGTAPGKKSGNSTLFDGESLNGWRPLEGQELKGWVVRNGLLIATPGEGTPLLVTDATFNDFEFECDFWLANKGNSGVYLRGRYELQLLDDRAYPEVSPKNRCGSIVGQLAPSKSVYRGPNQWNKLSVRLEEKTVTVILNGVKVIDGKPVEKVTTGAVNDDEAKPGPIALQHHGSEARFRNLKIRDLSQPAEDDNAAGDPDQRDMELITGEWLTIAEETNGKKVGKDEVKIINRRLTIKDTRFKMTRVMGGQSGTYEGTIALNPATNPKQFDFSGIGPRGAHVEFRGIYEVSETSLKLYYRYVKRPETKRPKAFKTAAAEFDGEAFCGITCKRDTD